jgi:rubrerythrin
MDTLKFAIKMENDGEKYYLEQAKLYAGSSLSVVFENLAQDERNHAEILENKLGNRSFNLVDNHTLEGAQNIFKNLKDINSEIRDVPNQLDVYRAALNIEQDSIDLYKSFLEKTSDEVEKELFSFLVKQEEEHYSVLEELIKLVNRPNDWVESAEFGIKKEEY